jgi:hypothetical protein
MQMLAGHNYGAQPVGRVSTRLRLRGGSVDFGWNDEGLVPRAELHGRQEPLRIVVFNQESARLSRTFFSQYVTSSV